MPSVEKRKESGGREGGIDKESALGGGTEGRWRYTLILIHAKIGQSGHHSLCNFIGVIEFIGGWCM